MVPIHELGSMPSIYLVSSAHLQTAMRLPDYLRLSLVCITLSHRINRTRQHSHCNALAANYYRHRGMVIRALNEDLDEEQKRTGDIVLAGILMLLLADVSVSSMSNRHNPPY